MSVEPRAGLRSLLFTCKNTSGLLTSGQPWRVVGIITDRDDFVTIAINLLELRRVRARRSW
ncbi:hypothetical protein OH492_23970 [Vibrio chagasii]|nr:hypothetical protein [Vibrio chagasii]